MEDIVINVICPFSTLYPSLFDTTPTINNNTSPLPHDDDDVNIEDNRKFSPDQA